MPHKRKSKKGCVYLLKSRLVTGYYKYGCTTLAATARCKRVNSEYLRKGVDYSFEVVAATNSNDIYTMENKVKWSILPFGLGAMSEVIDINDLDVSEQNLIDKFMEITNG